MAEGDEAGVAEDEAPYEAPPVEFDHDWHPGQGAEEPLLEGPGPELHVPSPEEAEALNGSDPGAAQAPPEPIVTEAAFLVYLDINGHWCGDSALVNRPVIVAREAGMNDYRHACADMSSDLAANEAANRAAQATIGLQQQIMMQAVQQRQAQEIGEKIGIPGGGVDLAELKRRAEQGGIRPG